MGKQVRMLIRAVPEPCKAIHDGALVISLVLQPDDSIDSIDATDVDLSTWPSEIFSRLKPKSIRITFDTGYSLPATILDWIPRPAASEERDALWAEAIGRDLLDATARTPPSTLVPNDKPPEEELARRAATYVLASPVDRLAMSATAITAAAVFGQMAMHMSNEVGGFAAPVNPLAPSTQQSQVIFEMFPGTRPDQPTDSRGDDNSVDREFGVEGLQALANETVRRIEDYGRAYPDASSRVQPFFGNATKLQRTSFSDGAYRRVGRISAALGKSIAERMGEARANGARDGRPNFGPEQRRSPPAAAAFYQAAWQAVAGDPTRTEASRSNEAKVFAAQLRGDYADYLLGMQPDDVRKVANNRDRELHPSDKDQASKVMGVIGGMYAHPQLAAFFGLIIDVTIPAKDVPHDAKFMRADFSDGMGVVNAPVWTAIDRQGDGTLQLRAREKMGPDSQCSLGLLHLGDTERFDIVSLSVNAAVDGWMSAARSDRQAREDGARRSDLASGMPAQHGVGLSIVDRFRREAGANALTSDNKPDVLLRLSPEARVLYLEDLIAGYRIDVATQNGGAGDWTWLSLMDREISFPEIERSLRDPAPFAAQPNWPVDRLGGSVQAMHRDVQVTDGTHPPIAVVYETLACWRNWSLAVPTYKAEVSSGDGEIQLERTIAPKDGSLPSLRFGAKVKFGARCMLINGSSVTLEEAAQLYEERRGQYVLEEGLGAPAGVPGEGFPVLRHEPLPTPRVFHHKPPPADKIDAHDARNVVVRTSHNGVVKDARAERVVLPGETTFDMAELHGALDDFRELPNPPYQRLVLSPKLGAAAKLPVMQEPPPNDAVLSYPDPKAQFLTLAFTENGQPAEQFGFAPPMILDLLAPDARGRERQWPDMAGLSLELVAVPLDALPLHNRIVGDFDAGDTAADDDGLCHLKVRLAPAEQIDLTVWSLPKTVGDLATQAPLAATLHFAQFYPSIVTNTTTTTPSEAGKLAGILKASRNKSNVFSRSMDDLADGSSDGDLLLRALRRLPIPALTSYQKLRLVHAVERPLAAPALEAFWSVHSPPPDPTETDHEKAIRAAWENKLNEWGIQPDEDLTDAAKQAETRLTPGSNRIFFGGRIRFHRKSTSRLDLRGVWNDWRDDIAPRKDTRTGKFCFIPEPHVETLMSIKDIDYRRLTGDGDVVGLARDLRPAPKPTNLGYTFDDTRARSIVVNARALSRFRGQFGSSEEGVDDRFSTTSDGTPHGDWRLIVRSTTRPKQLPPLFCAPSLHYAIEEYEPEDRSIKDSSGVRHRRTVRLRYDLGERFYATGFEERVGLVCWPPNLFDAPEIPKVRNMRVEEVEPAIAKTVDTNGSGLLPKGATQYVTRWGRDPIHDSGDLPALVPASAFRNCLKSVRTVMPLPADKKPGDNGPDKVSNSTLEVSLALYDPVLDPATGRFYVDIEVNQHETYEPWISLGLVRYQEHSLDGFECSLPVRSQVRVPADRQLEFEVSEAGRISLRYSGVGYHGAYIPRILRHNSNGLPLGTSTLSVTVMRTPIEGVSGAPAVVVPFEPGAEPDGLAHIDVLRPRISDGQAEWVVGRFADGAVKDPNLRELALPADCSRDGISVLVTEYEHYAADNFQKTFGSSRSDGSDFEEPLEWADGRSVGDTDQTVTVSRIVSAVHLRMRAGAPDQGEDGSGSK